MSLRATSFLAIATVLAAASPVAVQGSTGDCAPDLAALSGWDGIWISEGNETGINGRVAAEASLNRRLAGLEAPWNDLGWRRFGAMLRIAMAGETKQAGWGFPMMMDTAAPLKFVIAPNETVIASQYREVRYVYTDGRGHVPEEDRYATTWGDSIGCWESGALTIETVGAKFDPGYNYWAPPLSEEARFVERLRLVAPGRIEGEMTITDPVTLTAPWTVSLAFVRVEAMDRLIHESDIFENDRSLVDRESLTIAPPRAATFEPISLPTTVELSPAELDRIVGRYAVEGLPLELIVERQEGRLVFQVPPSLTTFLPLFAESPLSFASIDGGTFRFLVDEAGSVTGFEGTAPNGMPVTGKRIAP